MAIFNSITMGEASKSIGNVTLCKSKGRKIARIKLLKIKNPRTPKQLAQRAKMKYLAELALRFASATMMGFSKTSLVDASNLFLKKNMGFVTADEEYVCTIDQRKVICSAGGLCEPLFTVEKDSEEGQIVIGQMAGTVFFPFISNKDDQFYAVLFERVKNQVVTLALKGRGESGSTVFLLPPGWKKEQVSVYGFAVTANGKKASNTIYVE